MERSKRRTKLSSNLDLRLDSPTVMSPKEIGITSVLAAAVLVSLTLGQQQPPKAKFNIHEIGSNATTARHVNQRRQHKSEVLNCPANNVVGHFFKLCTTK